MGVQMLKNKTGRHPKLQTASQARASLWSQGSEASQVEPVKSSS